MEILIAVLLSSFGTWYLVYEYFYSPKAQIERYWAEIHKISAMINELKKAAGKVYPLDLSGWENEIEIREKIISGLLDRHFNWEDDEDYIENNRPYRKHSRRHL